MNNDIKITIVTPTYNRAHTLPRVFNSLKKQSFLGFKWLIMDDGSTDNTKEVVEGFKEESPFEIEYYYLENSKKFYTSFLGIEKVESPFFTILDSDDAYIPDALETMYQSIKSLDSKIFISATFNSITPEGKLVGTPFPEGLEGSILEMRYKHKVRGDKHTIFNTSKYHRYLKKFDYSKFKGKYAPQKIFFHMYDAAGERSKFINKYTRIYYQDNDDANSMSKDRVKPTSYEGLLCGHLSFINNYKSLLFVYPVALIRNIVGYQYYSFKNGSSFRNILMDIQPSLIKVLSWGLLPFGFLYHKVR
ncbi:glycosyltransferase family A protein [Bergeyella sp. RCAD1439]|uniref:glycosyltransferase family A protein n=1 Tax=Bergeyella anatis TaxID=3113737 RepID=UPI002E17C159|nr:glycosyltransferase family 2 protein [Bergeyella sp. RCAD1439]